MRLVYLFLVLYWRGVCWYRVIVFFEFFSYCLYLMDVKNVSVFGCVYFIYVKFWREYLNIRI